MHVHTVSAVSEANAGGVPGVSPETRCPLRPRSDAKRWDSGSVRAGLCDLSVMIAVADGAVYSLRDRPEPARRRPRDDDRDACDQSEKHRSGEGKQHDVRHQADRRRAGETRREPMLRLAAVALSVGLADAI